MQQTVRLRPLGMNKRGVNGSDCMLGHRWHMDHSVMFHMAHMEGNVTVGMLVESQISLKEVT